MIHAREDYNRIQDPAKKIPAKEPVFLLRAQDKFAASAVRYWAVLVRANGGNKDIIHVALAHAEKMEQWAEKKMPDLAK